MSTLTAYAAGVSTTGKEMLSTAMQQTFGDISITELDKDNMRYSVRLASKTNAVVLVVLDSSSEYLCKDLISDLIASDKYYKYSTDAGLIHFLNEKYGLSLEETSTEDVQLDNTPLPANEVIDGELDRLKERFSKQLEDKDAYIRHLLAEKSDLEKIIDSGGYSIEEANIEAAEALKKVQEEVLSLRSSLTDYETAKTAESTARVKAETRVQELEGELQKAIGERDRALSEYEVVSRDLAVSREDASRKSGVIRDKEVKIASLEATALTDHEALEQARAVAQERDDLAEKVVELTGKISGLEHTKQACESRITQLEEELQKSGKDDTVISKYKADLDAANLELSQVKAQLQIATASLQTLRDNIASLETDLKKAKTQNSELEKRLESQDADLILLNEQNLTLLSRIEVLENSSGRDTDVESALNEAATLRRRVSELESGLFHRVASTALPRSATRAKLIVTHGLKYENIRFVFSGSTESRKGTYRCLRREFSEDPESNYLLVDIVTETSVDYVFEIKAVVNGLKWFTDGGGVHPFISQTCLQNVKVLSPGMQYINDSYFLTMDWEKRLKELNSSGYKVVVYCGDLSNLVGRVIFDTVSELGTTNIYVHGNSVGSRTMVTASGGVTNIANATVKYFEYDSALQRFYNLVAKRCSCEIVSYSR